MDKREQLIEYITQDLISFIIEENKIGMKEAMYLLYKSKTYEKLLDVQTGMYLESSPYVYDILKDECKYGKIVQKEY